MNEITQSPVIVNVTGSTKAERQLSVVNQAASISVYACLGMKGKVGSAIGQAAAKGGVIDVARKAAWPTCDYKPFADMLAIRTGSPVVVSGRAAFESFADRFAGEVLAAKVEKVSDKTGKVSNGWITKKDGTQYMGAKLALAVELETLCRTVVRIAEETSAENKAKAEQAKQIAE
jgi:hypothetical protein